MNTIDLKKIENKIIKSKQYLQSLSTNIEKDFFNIESYIKQEIQEIDNLIKQNKKVIPEIHYQEIVNNNINNNIKNLIKKRGCIIIRGVFDKKITENWNTQLTRYIDENNYFEHQKQKEGMNKYFSDLKQGAPQIFGLYWSKPQVEVRQSYNLAVVKSFLNRLWTYEINGKKIFDPDKELVYADRVRRRQAGDDTLGLSPHCDAGSVERWITEAFQKIYKPIFEGNYKNYDPFNANFRDETEELYAPDVSHVFRTFQGWMALTEQGPLEGTLQLIPIAKSICYILYRALLKDIPSNSLCGSVPGRALSVNPEYHSLLLKALITIPKVYPGDTVWWHPDVVHGVEYKHKGGNYSNVIYVGSTPYCQKNLDYAVKQSKKFLEGKSPPDFAAEDYEIYYKGRATINDLTDLGKKQLALLPWD